ncbi:MAG: F0F1 ATP synthase subunit delta [Patescibacteria group bacterium]|nr:F0F1 ATP synthase subunit delta [Patescibacteria group bacterium]
MNAKVITAKPLSKEEQDKLQAILEKKFSDIFVEYHTEPEILGGIRIEVGDWVFDGTIAKKIQHLVHALKQ